MKKANLITCSVLLLVSLAAYWETRSFPPAFNPKDVGAAYYPNVLISMIVVLSILLIFNTLRNVENGSLKFSSFAFYGIVTACVYVLIAPLIGYLVATALVFPVSMYLLGIRSIKTFVVSTVGFLIAAYLVFFQVFGIVPPSL